jgi:hypothetical protein
MRMGQLPEDAGHTVQQPLEAYVLTLNDRVAIMSDAGISSSMVRSSTSESFQPYARWT